MHIVLCWHWLTFEVHNNVCVGRVSQSVGCLRWWPGFTYRKQRRVAFRKKQYSDGLHVLCSLIPHSRVRTHSTCPRYLPLVLAPSTLPQYLPRRYTNTQNMLTNYGHPSHSVRTTRTAAHVCMYVPMSLQFPMKV